MFKIRRFYLDSIGVPSNRFVNVEVSFTGLDDNPVDSLALLRNGAGKTTQIALLLAQILADRSKFLVSEDRKGRKRTLEALVQTGDTAHSACEWEDWHGNRLLTGAVYEWRGKVRPRDFDGQGKQQLECRWWCLRPDPSVSGAVFDELPFPSRSHGAVDLRAFIEHLQSLPAQGVDAVVCKQVKEWNDTLRDRGFDPDLFNYFRRINGSEGGVEKLFAQIDGPESFVRFLLELVVETSRASDVRDLLADTAVEIAKRPAYETDRRFCLEGVPLIEAIGFAHGNYSTAIGYRDHAYAEAARFKRCLLDTADADQNTARLANARFDDLAIQARTTNTEAEQNRRIASEYRRIAADMRLASAEREVKYRQGVADRAKTEQQAWEALERLLEQISEQDRLQRQEHALAVATEDAAPLRDDIATCERRLVGVLNRTIADAEGLIEDLCEYIDLMAPEIDELEIQEREAIAEASRLTTEREVDGKVVQRFEEQVQRAVANGTLASESEHPADALARWEADGLSCTRQVIEFTGAVEGLDADLRRHGATRSDAATELANAKSELRDAQATVRALEDRRDVLAANVRLQHLAQADDIDTISDSRDLTELLSKAIAESDRQIVDERVDGADDERAVHSLNTTGLLPPRRAVEHVCAQLSEEGVTAFSGWAYLAQHIDTTRHREVIEAIPDVVDGVVVYGDPATAANSIVDVPTEPVVIAAASTFTNPGDSRRSVVGPSLALHDSSSAELELATRVAALDQREGRVGALQQRREEDARLREQLHVLDADVGPNGLQPHLDAVEFAKATVEALSSKVSGIDELIEDISGRRNEATDRLAATKAAKANSERHATVASSLRDDFHEVYEPARSRLQSVDERIRAAEDRQKQCNSQISENRDQLGQWKQQRRDLETQQRGWKARLAAFPSVDPIGGSAADDLTLDLAELALKDAEALYETDFPEQTLRASVKEAQQRVKASAIRFEQFPEAAKRRSRELVTAPEAADADLRREARERAATSAGEENQRLGSARAERKNAEADVRETRPPEGRRAHAEAPEQPNDRGHARQLAADANERAGQLARRTGELERERDDAKNERDEAQRHAQTMRDLADRFLIDPAEALQPTPLIADDDTIRRDTSRLAQQCTTADNSVTESDGLLRREGDRLRSWAQQDQYARLSDDEQGRAARRIRELIRGDLLYERLAPNAVDYRDELASRASKITQHIEQVERTKQNVVSRLVEVAATALGDLARVSTLSTLPEGIGPWENHRFLIIEPVDGRPSHDQIQVRVADVVERLVASADAKITLKPVELLQQATIAAAGANGFRASVLKPSPEQSVRHVPVDEMSLWSGGEVLTASLVLFCSMAKLRAENRSTSRRHSQAGVIPLDNPLGSANYIEFLHLQRLVAHANGAQLIYWTGLGDMGAVAAFPRVIPMRKRASLSKPGHEYVTIDGNEAAQAVSAVDAIHKDPWVGSES